MCYFDPWDAGSDLQNSDGVKSAANVGMDLLVNDKSSLNAVVQAFLRLPGCVVHSAQANRPKEVSHV